MPVFAETNFCRDGFSFARHMFETGSSIACFGPNVAWVGKCTSKNSKGHTHACRNLFNNRMFCLPLSVSLDIVKKSGNDNCKRGFARSVSTPKGLEEMCLAMPETAPLAKQRMIELNVVEVDARTLRNLMKMGGVPKSIFLNAAPQNALIEDTVVLDMYRGWFSNGDRLPRNFDERIFTSACLVVKHLPRELRLAVLQLVFEKPTPIRA